MCHQVDEIRDGVVSTVPQVQLIHREICSLVSEYVAIVMGAWDGS